jgi:hypothetical protein
VQLETMSRKKTLSQVSGKSPLRLIGSGVTFIPPPTRVGPTDPAGTFLLVGFLCHKQTAVVMDFKQHGTVEPIRQMKRFPIAANIAMVFEFLFGCWRNVGRPFTLSGWTYPGGDYTARVIPTRAGAAVPLEAPQILWQTKSG